MSISILMETSKLTLLSLPQDGTIDCAMANFTQMTLTIVYWNLDVTATQNV